MWSFWSKILRGKLSLRRFLLFATSFVMVVFAATAIFPQTAYALDAKRSADSKTLTMNGNTYSRIDQQKFTSDNKTKNLPIKDYDGFSYESGDKIYLVLVDGNATTSSKGQAVNYTLKNGAYDSSTQSDPEEVNISTGEAGTSANSSGNSENSEDSSEDSDGKATCTMAQVGWFVCPLTNLLANVMDGILYWINTFLAVNTLNTNTDQNPVYEIWAMIRNLSNLCFVIVFLVIIYSQITGLGLSNYSLKAMLPRLIVAAILVNVSYWIAGALVDISNLLGYGVQNFFTDVRKNLTGYDQLGTDLGWGKLTAVVMAGGGTLAVMGKAVLFEAGGPLAALPELLAPLLAALALAAVVALLILAARQAIVTVCVLISPLAFVAYVLPSTNKYFDKWKDLFLTMLLMFPIISFVFGAAQLAGYAIIANAGDSPLQILVGMGVQIAPVAITPMIVKLSGNVLGKFAGIVNDKEKGLIDRTRNWGKARGELIKNRQLAGAPLFDKKKRRQREPGWLANKRGINKFGWSRALAGGVEKAQRAKNSALDGAVDGANRALNSKTGRFLTAQKSLRKYHNRQQRLQSLTSAYEAQAKNRATAWDNELYGERSARNQSGIGEAQKTEVENDFYGSEHGQRLEERARNANIRKTELDNIFDRSARGQAVTRRQQLAEIDKTRVQNEFNETTAGREVDRARRVVERQKQTIEQNLEKNWHELNLRDANSQNAEMTLRIRTDEAAAKKLEVDAIYEDLKTNTSQKIIGSRLDANTEARLKQAAHDAALATNVISGRKSQAEIELSTTINSTILSNSATVSGVKVQDMATGVGERVTMLAREAAKQEKTEDAEIAAAATLHKYFNVESSELMRLATQKDASITRQDSHGNTVTFDFKDMNSRIAAAQWIASNGAYSQKEQLALSIGQGNANEQLSGPIMRMLTQAGFGKQAAWFNDIAINEAGQGRIRTLEDIEFHTFRQILEGRQNAEKLSTNNDKIFGKMRNIFNARANNDDNWKRLVNSYAEYMRNTLNKDENEINNFIANAETAFDARYFDTINNQNDIQSDPLLSKNASNQVHRAIATNLADYYGSDVGRKELEYRTRVEEALKRVNNGTETAADRQLISESYQRYII